MTQRLPVGVQDFQKIIRTDCYYVDKTRFIKSVMTEDSDVLMITRPRRFGKTLFMDTLARFLRFDEGRRNTTAAAPQELFAGLEIARDQAFCNEYMGQFPVVFFSLKSVYGDDFTEAYENFAQEVLHVCEPYRYLIDSEKLTESDKQYLRRLLSLDYLEDLRHKATAQKCLKILVSCLSRHHERPVVLLIDEYDVPLAKAAAKGYYDEMIGVVRPLLENGLKSDPDTDEAYLRKAVLTGCLRVGKESIFTGLNNPGINTVYSEDRTLCEAIGFTADEVQAMLAHYGLAERFEAVRRWYDGYRFYRSDIYCPWDVVNFCSKALASDDPNTYEPKNYWLGTSGNDVIEEFLDFLTDEDTARMQTLVDGGTVEITVNDKLNYNDFAHHNPQDFWTLLLFTGYLTAVEPVVGRLDTYRVRIPNEGILDAFKKNIEAHFSETNRQYAEVGQRLAAAVFGGDAEAVKAVLAPLLRRYVSVRDAATKAPAENYYHGFLSAMLACAGDAVVNFHSNAEAGDGFADLVFTSADQTIGVVVEIKRCEKRQAMPEATSAAVQQIKERHYVEGLDGYGCRKVWAYGVAFCGKSCLVSCERLLPSE